ncbi:MAG: T9SS type A sorting domain-containing protein [Saprospiraceae bacterium]|nr:T9SS type A sorting domain-containing protein [Saprospiraceae bacterium]
MDTLKNGELGFTGTDSTWRNVEVFFDSCSIGYGNRAFELRYVLCTDSVQTNQEGWVIDDVVVSMYVQGGSSVKRTVEATYLEVYPNPSTGLINIDIVQNNDVGSIESIQVFSNDGRLVQSYESIPNKSLINLEDLPKGVYYLKVQTTKQSELKKIILH